MASTVRLGYNRLVAIIDWPYSSEDAGNEQKEQTPDIPFYGTLSAIPNYLIETLRKQGINSTLVVPEKAEAGSPNETGHYNGLIGLLQHNEADLGLVPIRVYELQDILDSSPIFEESKGGILSATTEYLPGLDYSLDLFLIYPILVVCLAYYALIIVALLLSLIHFFQEKCNISPILLTEKYFSFIWELIRFPLNQISLNVKGFKNRVLLFSFSFAILFLSLVGTNLMGSNLVAQDKSNIDTLEQLLNKEKGYHVKWVDMGSVKGLFKGAAKGHIFNQLWEMYKDEENESLPSIVANIHGGDYALLEDKQLLTFSARILCSFKPELRLRKAPETYSRSVFGFGYNKQLNKTIKTLADTVIQRGFESGFGDRFIDRSYIYNDYVNNPAYGMCLRRDEESSETERVEYQQMTFIFVFLRCSYLVGLVILLLEHTLPFFKTIICKMTKLRSDIDRYIVRLTNNAKKWYESLKSIMIN